MQRAIYQAANKRDYLARMPTRLAMLSSKLLAQMSGE
jgi:hypothetical protein